MTKNIFEIHFLVTRQVARLSRVSAQHNHHREMGTGGSDTLCQSTGRKETRNSTEEQNEKQPLIELCRPSQPKNNIIQID
jgi:hypothetical protein